MSQYLVLVYEDEKAMAASGSAGFDEVVKGHEAFGEKHRAKLAGGNALQSIETATSIRPDGSGGFTVTDGPFAATKETLGGYYLVEAADLEEAIALAKEIPAPHGGLEVRPIRVLD